MTQTALMLVDESPIMLQIRLKRAWDAIEARKHADNGEYRLHRALALADYAARGLSCKQLAEAVGLPSTWIYHLLQYGQFMHYASTVVDAPIFAMHETQFRRYWQEAAAGAGAAPRCDGDHEARVRARREYRYQLFAQILRRMLIEGATTPPDPAQEKGRTTRRLITKILAACSDGKFHLLSDIATAVEADMAVVRHSCERLVKWGSHHTFGERRPAPPSHGSVAYRFVKGGKKKIDVTVLQAELKSVLDDIDTVINGHHVHFSQQAMKLAFAELRKVIDRIAR